MERAARSTDQTNETVGILEGEGCLDVLTPSSDVL